MKSSLKLLLKIFLITAAIFIIAVVAAPFFVRQDQIKEFIQNKVALASGSKLAIEGDISFGIFPYSFVKVPKAIITDKKGSVTSINDIKFGFNITSLLKKNVTFDIGLKLDPTEYKGSIEFRDYQGFLNSGQSPIVITLEKPVTVDAKADFERDGDKISLKNIKAVNKQTELTGNFESVFSGNSQKITVNGTVDTQNLDDLRKLYKLIDKDDSSLLSGLGKIDFNLSTSGVKSEDFVSNLNGQGSIDVSQAAIYGLDFNELISTTKEIKITKNHNRKIEITKANATFTITNGVAVTKDLKIINPIATAQANGQADFSKQILAINLDIDANLAGVQMNVPLTVGGNFNNLKIVPRGADAVLNNLSNIQNLSKVKLNNVKLNLDADSLDQLKDLGKGLKSLLNKNGATQQPAQPAQ